MYNQLIYFMGRNSVFEKFQSGFCSFPRTETASCKSQTASLFGSWYQCWKPHEGSVFGLLLFIINMLPLGQITHRPMVSASTATLMTPNCVSAAPNLPPISLPSSLPFANQYENLNLKLNSNKTELMVVASRALLQKVGDLLLAVDGCTICPSAKSTAWVTFSIPPCLLNPTSNPSTNWPSTTSKTSLDSGHHSLAKWQRPSLTLAFVTSCLDYCNRVLFGVPSKALGRLQYV